MSDDSNRARSWVSVTDKKLIRRQKLRLALVNMVVLAVIWTLLSFVVYLVLVRQTEATADARLWTLADRTVERGMASGELVEPTRLGDSDADTEFAVWKMVGFGKQPILVSSSIRSPAFVSTLAEYAKRPTNPRFFVAENGETAYRVLQVSGPHATVLQICSDIAPQLDVLRHLLTLLAFAGIAGIGLTIVGGYSLGRWTLRPIMAARRREQGFVADVSHELRTPLSVMMTHLELLLRHVDDPLQEHMRWMEAIYNENRRMSRLVDDLLDLARTDAGAGAIELKPVSLSDLCADAAMLYEPVLEERGLRLVAECPEGMCALGDMTRLRQLLVILLDNANKYTETGSVSLFVRRSSGHIEITVKDTGIGIAPDLLSRVTERFVRGDAARTKVDVTDGEDSVERMTSTGLGLSIAKTIVEAHEGRLSISSALGKGTTVTVRLRVCDEKGRQPS